MLSMDVNHPDIEDFINIKNDLNKVTKANISVMIDNNFMDAVINDNDWTMRFETEHGEILEKTVKANYIMNLLSKNNWNTGEPGVMFMDRIHNWNLTSGYDDYKIVGTNPLTF